MKRTRTWRGKVFIGTSIDGFIAREDGDIDWLVSRGELAGDTGYDEFMTGIDAHVVGRATYDLTGSFPEWPFGDHPVLVLSRTLETDDERVTVVRSVADASRELDRQGATGVYIDGGQTIQAFTRAGMVDEMIISRVPVLIGSGKPLFGAIPADIDLELVSQRSLPGGMVQTFYQVCNDD